jgi:hypothetical protein
VLRVKFTVPSSDTSDLVLLIHMGVSNSAEDPRADWRSRFSLYDGAILLGVFDVEDTVGFFKSPDSTLNVPSSGYGFEASATVADFRSIVSGTIDGRVDLSMLSGARVLTQANLASITVYAPSGKFRFGVPVPVSTRQLCR